MENLKRVVVTGATRGIGESIVSNLLSGGYAVHMLATDCKALQAKKNAWEHRGELSYSVCDLSKPDELKMLGESWQQPIYGIVNNAGICIPGKIDDDLDMSESLANWNQVLSVNLTGVFQLTKSLLPFLEDNGRIVNISSQLGLEARAGYGAYCASKFGLIGLTKCWAKELGAKGITANVICPGWVKTQQAMNDMERLAKERGLPVGTFYEEVCSPLELKRFTEPEEVSNLVEFLLSGKASGITGRDWLLNTIWNQE